MSKSVQTNHRRSTGSSFVSRRRTGIDAVAESIERGSRSPFGHQQANRDLIDSEILAGFADPNEMEYAEESSTYSRERFMKSHPDEVEESAVAEILGERTLPDFRDIIDECECDPSSGRSCIMCCTSIDLMAIPDISAYDKVNVRMQQVGSHFEEVCDLVRRPDPDEVNV